MSNERPMMTIERKRKLIEDKEEIYRKMRYSHGEERKELYKKYLQILAELKEAKTKKLPKDTI